MKTAYERVTELVSGVGVRAPMPARASALPDHKKADLLLFPSSQPWIVRPEAEDDARQLELLQFSQPTPAKPGTMSVDTRPEPPDGLIEQQEELLELRT